MGTNVVFASMDASASGGVRYPLSGRRFHASVNVDIGGGKLNAWLWVTGGMDLDCR